MRIHIVTKRPDHPAVASWLMDAGAVPSNIHFPAPHVVTWEPTEEDVPHTLRSAFVFGPRWMRIAVMMTEFSDEEEVRIDYDPKHLLAELSRRADTGS